MKASSSASLSFLASCPASTRTSSHRHALFYSGTLTRRRGTITLTGDQLRGLHTALLDAYLDRHDLEMLLFYSLDKRLTDYVGDTVGLHVVVFRVIDTAKQERWLDRLVDAVLADRSDNAALRGWAQRCGWGGAFTPEPMPAPAQQLLDSTFFDLQTLRSAIRAARREAPGRLLGLGLHDTDMTVVDRVCAWLPHCLGEAETKALLTLRPDVGSVDARIKQTLAYLPDLDAVNVICPILTSGVPATVLAAFWEGLRAQLGMHRHWFVAIFTGSVDAAPYPGGITRLAAPVIEQSDLDDWTEQMARELGWPPPLAEAWSTLIVRQAADGARIDVRRMFEVMDRSVRDVRLRQPAFRRQLEELSTRADAPPR